MSSSISRIVQHYLKYPLMWVMLLWALTLPGQEVEVYRFLFLGSEAEQAPQVKRVGAKTGKAILQQEGIQAFVDARPSSLLVLKLPVALKPSQGELPQPTLPDAVIYLSLGVFSAAPFLSRRLPALQPNAP